MCLSRFETGADQRPQLDGRIKLMMRHNIGISKSISLLDLLLFSSANASPNPPSRNSRDDSFFRYWAKAGSDREI